MKLSVVIVTMDGYWGVLKPCLISLYRENLSFPFEVIVVDNVSTAGSTDRLSREFPQVRIIRNDHTLGFAASNNRGFAVSTGEYILMLNPDTEVGTAAVHKTLEFLEKHPEAGVAACRLLFPNGSLQRSLYNFPGVWNIFCETFFLSKVFPRTRLFGNYTLTQFDYDVDRQVDAVCGAYLMLRRDVLSRVGMLDEQFYMYSEEIDFCYRAKRNGFQIWFTAAGDVIHHWAGQSASNRRIILWSVGSQMMFYQKHFHGIKKYLLIGIKYFGILLRIPLYAAAGLLLVQRGYLTKSADYFFTARKVLRPPWKYAPLLAGEVMPWPNPMKPG